MAFQQKYLGILQALYDNDIIRLYITKKSPSELGEKLFTARSFTSKSSSYCALYVAVL